MNSTGEGAFGGLLHWEDLRPLFDFGSGNFLPRCQLQGIAGIYNILCSKRYAYLADEVGMGKTAQALGVASILLRLKPSARVLVVTPRRNLQVNWRKEFHKFVGTFYRQDDDVIRDSLLRKPSFEPIVCENLREYAHLVQISTAPLHLLRLTSFSRPVFMSATDESSTHTKYNEAIQAAGLARYRCKPAAGGERSRAYNLAFGCSLGSLLRANGSKWYYDLAIIDEAQYLRNQNQRNDVLEKMLEGNVDRWLFLSATPIHRQQDDIKRLLTVYVGAQAEEWPDDGDELALAEYLRSFMIRRNRQVSTAGLENLTKSDYRDLVAVEQDGIPRPGQSVSDLSSLAMAVVQKKLAWMAGSAHGSYKLGLLSSFETLRDTLTDEGDDYYWTEQDHNEGNAPPDASFVQRLSDSFSREFGMELEHPKLERVATELADNMYRTGEKVLVFCRRVNTVKALQSRVEQRYYARLLRSIHDRWGIKVDLATGPLPDGDSDEDQALANSAEYDDQYEPGDGDLARQLSGALGEKGWLQKFRRRFLAGGAFDLFFEENWLRLIAEMAGMEFEALLRIIEHSETGQQILREADSITTANDPAPRRNTLRYLAFHVVHRLSHDLGLPESTTNFLREGFAKMFGASAYTPRTPSTAKSPLPEYATFKGFWEVLRDSQLTREHQTALDMTLAPPVDIDSFYLRQLRMRWIASVLRLSPDTLLELSCSYARVVRKGGGRIVDLLAEQFVHDCLYPDLDTTRAKVLRNGLSAWMGANTQIIATNCFDDFADYGDLASAESYSEIRRLRPVVGMTGSTTDETALKQFNMPCFPLVLIATDIVKEGLNLHLNCRRVVHYGAAWTAGDMEQRIGRVDRIDAYFERYSRPECLCKILVSMPYLRGTLEEHQRVQIGRSYERTQRLLDAVASSEAYSELDVEAADKVVLVAAEGASQNAMDNAMVPGFGTVRRNGKEARRVLGSGRINPDMSGSKDDYERGLEELLKEMGWNAQFKRHDRREIAEVDIKGVVHNLYWDRYLPFLGCRSILAMHTTTGHFGSDSRIGFSALLMTEREMSVPKTARRMYVASPWASHRADFAGYFSGCAIAPVDEARTRELAETAAECLTGMEAGVSCDVQWKSSGHRIVMQLDGLGDTDRRQQATCYVYDDHLLVASDVCDVSSLCDDERFCIDRKVDEESVWKWIRRVNEELLMGYVHYRSDTDMLQVCERINYRSLPSALLARILFHTCLQADRMELTLTQADIT